MARGLSGGSCHPENYSSMSNRARVIARTELREPSVFSPRDRYIGQTIHLLPLSLIVFLFFLLVALTRGIIKWSPIWIWIMILEPKRENTRFKDKIKDSRVRYFLLRGFEELDSLIFYRFFFILAFFPRNITVSKLARIIYSYCDREFFRVAPCLRQSIFRPRAVATLKFNLIAPISNQS